MTYYNYKKEGHIARGYCQSTQKPKAVKKKVKEGSEEPLRKVTAV